MGHVFQRDRVGSLGINPCRRDEDQVETRGLRKSIEALHRVSFFGKNTIDDPSAIVTAKLGNGKNK